MKRYASLTGSLLLAITLIAYLAPRAAGQGFGSLSGTVTD
jgi:hypothetical protein